MRDGKKRQARAAIDTAYLYVHTAGNNVDTNVYMCQTVQTANVGTGSNFSNENDHTTPHHTYCMLWKHAGVKDVAN